MSVTTDKLNQSPTAKSNGILFLDANEFVSIQKSLYSLAYVGGISISYLLLSLHVVPMLFTGAMSISIYCLIHFGVALAWVGIGYLIKKFLLQDKLITKGELVTGDA